MNKAEIQAARARCEAAAILIDDEVAWLVARYSPAAAESIATIVATLSAALEALEEAQEENRRLREEMCQWVAAYSPDIVNYPSLEAVRAVNLTPEFIVGRNAMMQAIHDGLARILSKEGE